MNATKEKGEAVQPNYRRTFRPLGTVHVPLFIVPIKTKKEVRAFISQVDCEELPFVTGKHKVFDKWIYYQRTHNSATIVAKPMSLWSWMASIPGMTMNN